MIAPQVTIGIPIFNERLHIEETIKSAMGQSYQALRILIADNASTDGTWEIVQQYASMDTRIVAVRHDVNIGPVANFKFILTQATSEYFVWLGGHDVFKPNYVADAVELLEGQPEIVLAYPKSEEIDQHSQVRCEITTDYDTTGLSIRGALVKIARNFQNGYVIHGVFRTNVLRKLPFEKVVASDILMIFVAAMYGRIARIPTLGFWRREMRQENFEAQKERHVQQGIYAQTENPFELMFVVLCKHILRAETLPLLEKLRAVRHLSVIFGKRFKVERMKLIRAAIHYLMTKRK